MYLMIKNDNYRLIKCGSGKPIISDTTGKLKKNKLIYILLIINY
jgi:hypothetical protein